MSRKKSKSSVELVQKIWYMGEGDRFKYMSSRNGTLYVWSRPDRVHPAVTEVLIEDVEDILSIQGRGCSRRKPERMFLTDEEYKSESL